MPALQTLVLTDRASTPVNFTLNPVNRAEGGVGLVAVADSSGAVLTEKRFSISSRRANGRIRSLVKLRLPIITTEVINGVSAPKVTREAFVELSFNFADTSTEAERNDAVGMIASALMTTKPLVHDTIVKAQSVW